MGRADTLANRRPRVTMMDKTQPVEPTDTLEAAPQPVTAEQILAELAAYDDVELPADVQALFRRLAGGCKTSFEFSPETYFEGKQGVYDW
jgi:hypothetical protein